MLHFHKSLRLLLLFILTLPGCGLATPGKPTPLPVSTVKRIAFYSDAVYVINADGSNLVRLTDRGAGKPAWSPDGQFLAFNGRDFEIYVMNADGSNRTRLTQFGVTTKAVVLSPVWSPDGKEIAFITQEYDRSSSIYLINIPAALKGRSGSQPQFLNNIWGLADDLSWSPDSRYFILSHQLEYHEPFKIAAINIAAALQNPNESAWTDWGEGIQPAWSPDSQHLVFVSWSKDQYRGIYVINMNGGNQTPLTQRTFDVTPTWSPDGNHIAFVSQRDGNDEIYVMNTDGGQQTRLTNDPAEDTSPAWSPDSRQIAFVSKRDGNQEIYVMNADGSDQRRLTNTPDDEQGPVWAPLPLAPSTATHRASQVTSGTNIVLAGIILGVTAILVGILLLVLISEMRRKESNAKES